MSPKLLACLLGATLPAPAEPARQTGGFGPEHLTEDRHPPVMPGIDDAKLLELRKKCAIRGSAKPAPAARGWDLVRHSEFISFDGHSTLVPKHAIIHVPEIRRSCITRGLEGKFLPWAEFAARYRGLVHPFEVSLDEASGKTPIAPERFAAARKTDRILVAVLNGGPVSCHAIAPTSR